jgi:hypothetical protein
MNPAIRKTLLGFFFVVIYLVTSVPVGLFLYSLKSRADINIFSKTGFHSYIYCLEEQAALINKKDE